MTAGVIEYEILTPSERLSHLIRFHEPRFRLEFPTLGATLICDLETGGFVARSNTSGAWIP
jgi:hypothetical protein